METTAIPQVVAETASYLRAIDGVWDENTQREFKNFIGCNYLSGDIIPDTGGIRKIRWQGRGHGKRGGVRVIYYFYDTNHPIYLLFAYPKNVQDELTEYDRKILRTAVRRLKDAFRKEGVHNG